MQHTARCDAPRQCKPPVLAVIAFATLVSTAASMGGGLVMYFESLKSLEDTVRETSSSELASVHHTMLSVMSRATNTSNALHSYVYDNASIATDDPRVWGKQSIPLCYSFIRKFGLFALGYVLVPHNITDGTAVYSMAWAAPLRDGRRLFMSGEYNNYLVPNEEYFTVNTTAQPPYPTEMLISTHHMHNVTGEVLGFAYKWNGVSYLVDLIGPDYDPRNGLPPSGGWDTGDGLAVAHKWRPPLSWTSLDGTVYAYTAFDSVHVPPPAPHPWSKYRAVIISAHFEYGMWDKPMAEYKKQHPDTTVVIVDAKLSIVYASTTGEHLVGLCNSDVRSFSTVAPLSCAMKVSDMQSQAVKDAFEEVLEEPSHTFMKVMLGGEEHFVRKGAQLHQDAFLIWLRPVSSVEAKVQKALVVLVIFTLLVFVFDLMISILEVVFIALPMRHLSVAIKAIGEFETDVAQRAISRYGRKHVVVKEVHSLMGGMLLSISRLEEYRPYLPAALFELAEEAPDERHKSAAPGLDEGTVTIVFTDIRASTSIWEAAPDGMRAGLRIHNAVIRDVMHTFGGYEVKTIGDAFMIAFATTQDGMDFALKVHERLREAEWPPSLMEDAPICAEQGLLWCGLTVRIGINTGPVTVELNTLTGRMDYFGHTVNVASRLESACQPGAVAICSALCKDEYVARDVVIGASFRQDLKGVSGTTDVCCVWPAALAGRETNPLRNRTLDVQLSESCASESGHLQARSAGLFEHKSFSATVGVVEADTGEPGAPHSLQLMSATVSTLAVVLEETGGSLVSLLGNCVCVGWNLTRPSAAHCESAVGFAERLLLLAVPVGMGLVSGTVQYGAVGMRTQRFLTVTGRSVGRSWTLCEEAAAAEGTVALYEADAAQFKIPSSIENMLVPYGNTPGLYEVSSCAV